MGECGGDLDLVLSGGLCMQEDGTVFEVRVFDR